MVLLMTMKQRGAGMIGRELDFRTGLRVDEQDILHDAAQFIGGRCPSGIREGYPETAQLEAVAVKMQRMVVGTPIDELQTIASAALERRDPGIRIDSPLMVQLSMAP